MTTVNKRKTAFGSLALALLMMLSLIVPLIPTYAQSEGFVPVQINNPKDIYTPIILPGYDGVVYAFSGKDGLTQFRIYGKVNGKIGYYPVSVNKVEQPAQGNVQPSDLFSVELSAPVAVDDICQNLSTPKKEKPDAIPQGFKAGKRNSELISFVNVFGQNEYRVYGTLDGKNYGWFPSKNAMPVNGSLPQTIESVRQALRTSRTGRLRRPADMKKGYQTVVGINLGNDVIAYVQTAYPSIQSVIEKANTKHMNASTDKAQGLKLGSKGSAVKNLQLRLLELGYKAGKADGTLGRQTVRALKAFQKANGLRVDGIAGSKTIDRLYSSSAKPMPGARASSNATGKGNTPAVSQPETPAVNPQPNPNPQPQPESKPDPKPDPKPVITTKTETVVSEIPFTTEYKENPEREIGNTENNVLREGVDGERTIIYTITYTDGVETDRKMTSNEVTKEMVPKLIEVGTKAPDGTEAKKITETNVIKFEEERRANDQMLKTDPEKIIREGQDGEEVVTLIVTYKDGQEVSRSVLQREVTKKPISKIIEYGTKEPPVIEVKEETTNEDIPFTKERRANAEMLTTDAEKEVRAGVNGVKTITWKVTYTDGVVTNKEKVSETVTTEMIPQIVEYGTKQPPVTMSVSASAKEITKGESITFTWKTTGLDSVNWELWDDGNCAKQGTGGPSGSKTFTPGLGNGKFVIWDGGNRTKEVNFVVNPVPTSITYTYERFSIGGGSFAGTKDSSLDSTAYNHAMSMAKRRSVYHDYDSGLIESCGCYGEDENIVGRLIAHNPQVAEVARYGYGAVLSIGRNADGEVVSRDVYAVCVASLD